MLRRVTAVTEKEQDIMKVKDLWIKKNLEDEIVKQWELRIRYTDDQRDWSEIETIGPTKPMSYEQVRAWVVATARNLRNLREIRFNALGSQQGYYVRPKGGI
jgi:hypothetical protein